MTETQVQANGLRRPKGISCGDAAGVWLKAAERGDSGKRYQGLPVTGSSPGEQASSQLGQDPGLDSQGENRHRRARSTTGIPTQGEGQRGRCSDLLTRAQGSAHPCSHGGENNVVVNGLRMSGIGERSHREPGRLGSPLSQGCVRAESKDGHYRQRLMSKGQFIFKPDSFVLKYETMLSLWRAESIVLEI